MSSHLLNGPPTPPIRSFSQSTTETATTAAIEEEMYIKAWLKYQNGKTSCPPLATTVHTYIHTAGREAPYLSLSAPAIFPFSNMSHRYDKNQNVYFVTSKFQKATPLNDNDAMGNANSFLEQREPAYEWVVDQTWIAGRPPARSSAVHVVPPVTQQQPSYLGRYETIPWRGPYPATYGGNPDEAYTFYAFRFNPATSLYHNHEYRATTPNQETFVFEGDPSIGSTYCHFNAVPYPDATQMERQLAAKNYKLEVEDELEPDSWNHNWKRQYIFGTLNLPKMTATRLYDLISLNSHEVTKDTTPSNFEDIVMQYFESIPPKLNGWKIAELENFLPDDIDDGVVEDMVQKLLNAGKICCWENRPLSGPHRRKTWQSKRYFSSQIHPMTFHDAYYDCYGLRLEPISNRARLLIKSLNVNYRNQIRWHMTEFFARMPPPFDHGWSVTEIKKRLKMFSLGTDVIKAMALVLNYEGAVRTTINNEHFVSTKRGYRECDSCDEDLADMDQECYGLKTGVANITREKIAKNHPLFKHIAQRRSIHPFHKTNLKRNLLKHSCDGRGKTFKKQKIKKCSPEKMTHIYTSSPDGSYTCERLKE